MGRPVLGLTGVMCSGKNSWANFLVDNFGFVAQTSSDVIRTYIADNNLGEPTRDLCRVAATELRQRHGGDYLVKQALGLLPEDVPAIISGIYVPTEVDFIRGVGGKIVHIRASNELGLQRMNARARSGESGDLAEYQRLIDNDLHAADTDQRQADVIREADYEIDGSVPLADSKRCLAMARDMLMILGVEYARA